ncbi:MAG: type II toxin-antitoxin system RelE/ParE family toxin [Gemmataceae bacterium]
MIVSFACKQTERLFHRFPVKGFPPGIRGVALRKLLMISAAHTLNDLKVPPGNRLEKLQGDLAGLHSIRINSQWRICFRWEGGNAHDVEITDYH